MQGSENDGKVAFITCALHSGEMDTPRNAWILDSGATTHICSNRKLLTNATKLTVQHDILVGNGEIVTANESGCVDILPDMRLQDVLFCPQLKVNLISVNKLIEDGFDVYFSNDDCSIWKGKTKLLSTAKTNKLFMISTNEQEMYSAIELHRKVGHFSQMTKLKGSVNGVTDTDTRNIKECEICIQAKQTKSPISKGNQENAAKVAELLHIDLMGPITPCGRNAERYIINILDEKSKLSYSKALQHKSEAADVIINVINLLERQTKNYVKSIRSDRGTEFLNHHLQKFLEEKGITHQTSAPYSPHQNGNAERFNRTLIEKVRAVLLDSKLDKTFWPFAVEHCSYIRNRLPCQPHDRTPIEVAFGTTPDLSSWHIFGQECFVLKSPPERGGKLDSKSRKGIFVGYEPGSKDTFRIFCGNKIILSRNVKFIGESHHQPECNEEKELTPSSLQNITFEEEDLDAADYQESDTVETTSTKDSDEDATDIAHSNQSSDNEERRYPRRERRVPKEYWVANLCLAEPQKLEDALSSPQKEDWLLALQDEISSLQQNDVFDVVEKLPGIKTLPCKWVFKIKYDTNGNVQRFKARLVAKGFKQRTGVDFNETFAPVAVESAQVLVPGRSNP